MARRRPRVLLLRPPGSPAGKLAVSAVVAHIPVIDIEPLPRGVELLSSLLGRCDWLVFTSPRAPMLLPPELRRRIKERRRSGSLRVAAVGPRTQEALEEAGIGSDHVPREYRGGSLAEELAELGAGCVLLARSEKGVRELSEKLRARGVEVHEAHLYRVVVLDDMARVAARVADSFDYVVFTSPSIAEAFTRHYPTPGSPRFTPVAIGPTTAARLRELGYPEPLSPQSYTLDAVAELIAARSGVGT